MSRLNGSQFGGTSDDNGNVYSMHEHGWYRVQFESGNFIGRFLRHDKKGKVTFDRVVGTAEEPRRGMVCAQLERLSTIVHPSITGVREMTEKDVECIIREANFPLAYLGREVGIGDEFGVLRWVGDEFVILNPHVARCIRKGVAWGRYLSRENNYVPYVRQGNLIEPLPRGTLRKIVCVYDTVVHGNLADDKPPAVRLRRAGGL